MLARRRGTRHRLLLPHWTLRTSRRATAILNVQNQGRIWNVRVQRLDMLFRRLAIPVLSLAILCIGGCFALIAMPLS